jgi:hypothetical protein
MDVTDGTDERFALEGYVVDELIGFGGSGEVWRAHDAETGENVALKRLRVRGAGPTERLRREAALLATVAGPHVIGVRRMIVEADEAVLVMDYAAGGSLASVLSIRGQLPAAEVVTILAPIAAALAAAHARDLVHGDLTPANILFTADGRPLLADFGVAHALGNAPQVVEGTVDYLDPSVSAGSPVSSASDVFALGAIGYVAVSGESLWGPGTPDQIQTRASIGVRAPLDELVPGAPPALVAVIESALQLDPDDRPNARTMANAILRSGAAAPVRLVAAVPPIPASMTQPLVRQRLPVTIDLGLGEKFVVRATAQHSLLSQWRRILLLWFAICVALVASVFLGRALGRGPIDLPILTVAPAASVTAPHSGLSAGDVAPVRSVNWPVVVSRLDALRSSAFAAGDAAPLASVYVPGAAAYTADLRTVSSLTSRGLRARGFVATVEHVTADPAAASTTSTGTATSAAPVVERLRVVDRLSGYSLVDEAGRVVGRGAPRAARAFTMSLEYVAGAWRVAAITPV